MYKLLIFGGTSEGRRLWEFLIAKNDTAITVHISVASKYGEDLLTAHERSHIFVGKMNQKEMTELMAKEQYSLVIDASHPYATEVSKNVKAACQEQGTEYLRLLRRVDALEDFGSNSYNSMEEALAYLNQTEGNILITTGSKELSKCVLYENLLSRIYVRVLPDCDVIADCRKYGLEGRQIIAMQGPFSEELNIAILKQINAKYLLTKSSGQAGGFQEKVEAAKKAGVQLVLIGLLEKETGYTEEKIQSLLCQRFSLEASQKKSAKTLSSSLIKALNKVPREVTLIGIGMGLDTLTLEAQNALRVADVIIGAERLLLCLASYQKTSVPLISAEKIADFLYLNTKYNHPVIVFSGDIGFYSGAKPLYPLLGKYNVKTIPGISSPIYFLAKLKLPWQDVTLCSLHGNSLQGAGYVLFNRKCFFLLGKPDQVSKLCKALCDMNLSKTEIYIGERLSYPDEHITSGYAEDFCEQLFDPLAVLLCINKEAWQRPNKTGIIDTAFCRAPKVPMTKREVRAITMSALALESKDIFYDVGAGSGSVSIEAAFCCPLGRVYAIEQNEAALEVLQENRKAFGCGNIQVVSGSAPKALEALPPPDKVFIGGSGGELSKILEAVLQKNPSVKIVLNSIALETLASILTLFEELGIVMKEIIQVSIARGEKLGAYHIMKGQNPVFIISGEGGKSNETA